MVQSLLSSFVVGDGFALLNSIIFIACCRAASNTASSHSNGALNRSCLCPLNPLKRSIRAQTWFPESFRIFAISLKCNTGIGTFKLMISTFSLSWVTPGPGMVKQQHTPCTTKKVTARTSTLVRRRSSERHTRKMQGASTDARWRDGCKVRTPMQTAMDRNGNG